MTDDACTPAARSSRAKACDVCPASRNPKNGSQRKRRTLVTDTMTPDARKPAPEAPTRAKGSKDGKERLHLSLAPRSLSILKGIMEKTDASSYAEVFKNALRLYSAVIEEEEKGGEFYVKMPDGQMKQYKIFV